MPTELSETDVFVLLAKRRRRQLLRILRESPTPLTTYELARRIGADEHEEPSKTDVKTVRIALHHHHLPRLDAADVVEYDRTGETVRPGLNFDASVRVLESVSSADLPWSDQ